MPKLIASEKDPKAPSDIYKVEKVEEGWQVFFYFPKEQFAGTVKRPVDDGFVYTKRQAAYLRCKRLNDTHKSANIFTLHAKIRVQREDCQKVIAQLRGKVLGFVVHDPLNKFEPDERYITCHQTCRWKEEDFDPQIMSWQPQWPTQSEFYAFLESVQQMPEVESLETSEHSFTLYYP